MSHSPDPGRPPEGLVGDAMPAELTSFVGRADELRMGCELLTRARLVTFTGVGGVGKTRLAVHVAAQVSPSFAGGVWFVELVSLQDGKQVPQAVVETLGLPEPSTGAPVDVLIRHLAHHDVLLVLDNCEHVLDATADLAATLLQHAPGLRILATSREALNVPGEHRMTVHPLPVPTEHLGTSAIGTNAAVVLFTERARAIVPEFSVGPDNEADVAAVCRQLDGIPLAIELAAARMRIMSISELAARLSERFALLTGGSRVSEKRHQTLRATLDWSYSLCTPAERALWTKASVFADSFDLGSAEAVCGDGPEGVIDAITGLIDKSILLRQEANSSVRFTMLETIRQYGLTVEGPSIIATQRRRHLDRYLDVVTRATGEWFGPHQQSWSEVLRPEFPNLRAALTHCIAGPDLHNEALQLASPYFLWMACGSLSEGRGWLDSALALSREPSPLRATALWSNAFIANLQGQHEDAAAYARECTGLGVELRDPTAEAMGNHQLGCSALFGGSLDEATTLMEGVLTRYLDLGAQPDLVANLRAELGLAHLFSGRIDLALEQYERNRELCTSHGERWLLSYALWGIGLIGMYRGDIEFADRLVHESLEIKGVFRDPLGMAIVVETAAWIAQERGESRRAAILMGAAGRHWMTFSVRELFGNSQFSSLRSKALAEARRALGDIGFAEASETGARMAVDDLISFALGGAAPAAESVGATPDAREAAVATLTRREREITALVAAGLSNKEIARRLFISTRTAETHVQNALHKLGISSRAHIAQFELSDSGDRVDADDST